MNKFEQFWGYLVNKILRHQVPLSTLIPHTDEYMCSVEGQEDKILHESFKQLCYQTGKMIYNIKAKIDAAIQDHNRAYIRLNENFKRYMNQWETLGTDFYQ